MTGIRIIDRRYDSKHKSAINRNRFIRRFKSQIGKAVKDAINRRSIADIDHGEKIGIPAGDIAEPEFRHGPGGIRQDVLPGNDRYLAGDELARPAGGAGGEATNGTGTQEDNFAFSLSREEFLDIFFEDLALPNLVKTQLASIDEFKHVRAGFTSTGVPSNINIVRSMRGAAGRRIAIGSPYRRTLRQLREELALLEACGEGDSSRARELRHCIARLQRKLDSLPFIDTFDLRFNNRIRIPTPSTRAVMFCLMDVSGSMDDEKKHAAKRFYMLLYLFLTRTYRHIDVVFIRHHTQAQEVDEETFFHSRESGGTVVSSALELMHEIVLARYSSSTWNIYGAQASDGENWDNDSARCRDMLNESILPLVQYYAYIEIASSEPQTLWEEYERIRALNPSRFAMQRISGVADIYPVFRELFHKQLG